MEALFLYQQGTLFHNKKHNALKDENIFLTYACWPPINHLETITNDKTVILIKGNPPDNTMIGALCEVRTLKLQTPIVYIDPVFNTETKNKIEHAGADMYMAEPIEYRSLGLMLKKLVAKREITSHNRWLNAFNILLDLNKHCARRENRIFQLRNKEFSLLEFFMINRGKILPRSTILEYVWDRNATFASNTLDVHVNRLRRKIDDSFKSKLIHTVHSIGYRFGKE